MGVAALRAMQRRAAIGVHDHLNSDQVPSRQSPRHVQVSHATAKLAATEIAALACVQLHDQVARKESLRASAHKMSMLARAGGTDEAHPRHEEEDDDARP